LSLNKIDSTTIQSIDGTINNLTVNNTFTSPLINSTELITGKTLTLTGTATIPTLNNTSATIGNLIVSGTGEATYLNVNEDCRIKTLYVSSPNYNKDDISKYTHFNQDGGFIPALKATNGNIIKLYVQGEGSSATIDNLITSLAECTKITSNEGEIETLSSI
jgi:hypothetical protein